MANETLTFRRGAVNPAGDSCMLELRVIEFSNGDYHSSCEIVDVKAPSTAIITFKLAQHATPRSAKHHAIKQLKEMNFLFEAKDVWKPVVDKMNKHTVAGSHSKKGPHPLKHVLDRLIEDIKAGTVIDFKIDTTHQGGYHQRISMSEDELKGRKAADGYDTFD